MQIKKSRMYFLQALRSFDLIPTHTLMTTSNHSPLTSMLRALVAVCGILTTGTLLNANDTATELSDLYRSRIPKTEIGVTEFLEAHPEFDGRDVVIAVFDTGVDPGAPGLQVTTTGERKIVDLIDASGAGDVDTTTSAQADKSGTLKGLTGRELHLPGGIENPSGVFHIGVKNGHELFHEDVWDRVTSWRKNRMKASIQEADAERMLQKHYEKEKQTTETASDPRRVLDDSVKESELKKFEQQIQQDDPGPYYDCVVWNDGKNWRALVDTDEDGDLRDEKQLRAFGVAGEYASFPDYVALNFGIAVYHDGDLLSIITTSGSHGTHVASIASANYPDQPELNGVAPGARILSIRIGDTRIHGSSVYTGESRATATAARYQVDVMNASWGGQSIYQDASGWGCELYNTLVEKYNVTAFVSVGNDGPSLSSMGAPGGEAASVIGVGAYVSPEMSKLLYSVIDETPETLFMFSARGPDRNGDLGVDVVAPGAAIASLALDSVEGTDLYNGTSMSSPSAAGTGALLISAAKQSGLHYTPARIRYALMNSAKFLESESPFAQGAGLIQVPAAWEHLKRYQNVPELDVYYGVRVAGNRYNTGPGLYLRGDLPAGVRSYRMDLNPEFSDAVTNHGQYDFNADFRVSVDSDWIRVPEVVHLSNAGNYIRPEIDFGMVSETTMFPRLSTIGLVLANHPEAGPLIRIPVTLIEGESAVGENNIFPELGVDIDAAKTFRRFITPPLGATHLSVTLKRDSDEDVEKLFVLTAMTLVADEDIESHSFQQYFRLNSGKSIDFEIPTIPGEVMELSLQQTWSYDQPTHLTFTGTWRGIKTARTDLIMKGGSITPEVSVSSINDNTFGISAQLDRAVYSYFPSKTEIYPGDIRGYFPAGREESTGAQSFWLTQEFDVEFAEDQDVWFLPNEYHSEFWSGGGIYEVYDEKGLLVTTASASDDEEDIIHLPKGKLKIVREYTAHHPDTLGLIEKLPIILVAQIEPVPLSAYAGHKNFINGSKVSDLVLSKDHEVMLFVAPPAKSPYEDLKTKPDFLQGEVLISADDVDVESLRIVYEDGQFYQEPETEAATPAEGSENKEPFRKYAEAVYKQQLAFLRETRGAESSDLRTRRQEMYQSLIKAGRNDPELLIEDIYGYAIQNNLLHPWIADTDAELDEKANKKPNELLKKIQGMIDSLNPASVAQYLGMPPYVDLPDSPEAKRAEKETRTFKRTRQYIAEANLLAADANLVAGRLGEARKMLNETKRWQVEDDLKSKLQKIEILLLKQEGYCALALEALGKALEDNPEDGMLLDWRKELYSLLNWNEYKTYDDLIENLSKNASRLR